MARDNPQSGQAARDVSVSLERLADFLASRGQPWDGKKALLYYQRSLEVSEQLARDNPQSGQAARDVSVSLNKQADFLARRGQAGDGDKALGYYQRSLAIRRRIWADNPESAAAGKDLLISLQKTAQGFRRAGKLKDAFAMASESETLTQELEQRGFELGGQFTQQRRRMMRMTVIVLLVLAIFAVAGIGALVWWIIRR